MRWPWQRVIVPEAPPRTTVKIGRRSNHGNLRIVTFDVTNPMQPKMTIDRLDPQEGIPLCIPLFRIDGTPLTSAEMVAAIAETDES